MYSVFMTSVLYLIPNTLILVSQQHLAMACMHNHIHDIPMISMRGLAIRACIIIMQACTQMSIRQ